MTPERQQEPIESLLAVAAPLASYTLRLPPGAVLLFVLFWMRDGQSSYGVVLSAVTHHLYSSSSKSRALR